HDHGVLLEVVTLARNVADHLEAIDETDLRDLAQRRVGLLRRRGVDARAYAPLLRVGLHGRNLVALHRRYARLADQLVDGRHQTFLLSQNRCLKPLAGPSGAPFPYSNSGNNRLGRSCPNKRRGSGSRFMQAGNVKSLVKRTLFETCSRTRRPEKESLT